MADYKEQTIVGSSWMRASRVIADNTEGQRMIRFDEETVFVLPDGKRLVAPSGGVTDYFNEDTASEVFQLRDSEGVPTGATATYADVYCMMLSLYYQDAIKRDAAG